MGVYADIGVDIEVNVECVMNVQLHPLTPISILPSLVNAPTSLLSSIQSLSIKPHRFHPFSYMLTHPYHIPIHTPKHKITNTSQHTQPNKQHQDSPDQCTTAFAATTFFNGYAAAMGYFTFSHLDRGQMAGLVLVSSLLAVVCCQLAFGTELHRCVWVGDVWECVWGGMCWVGGVWGG